MGNVSRLTVNPARKFAFSPDWAEYRVVFDARSGDFWVVSEEVHAALCSASAVEQSAEAGDIPGFEALSPELAENLIAHGIIRQQTSAA